MTDGLIFKLADSPEEFEQIHRLNYRTFAEEVGQYHADGSGVLVDRFHGKNRYFIALENGSVVGMVAANDQPPFSVESRLTDPATLRSLRGPLLEVRLLALEPSRRRRMILAGIVWELYKYARGRGHSHLVISGVTSRANMYLRLGFRALGPAVSSGAASFIPMTLNLDDPPQSFVRAAQLFLDHKTRPRSSAMLSLMPGPVEVSLPVREAFARRPISHRCPEFLEAYERVRSRLSALGSGMKVALMVGGGTTANDAVALQWSAMVGNRPGVVLANGEFGNRLVGQAGRASLNHTALRWPWGTPWDFNEIEDAIRSGARWIWATHLETSTGMLNDVSALLRLARHRGVRVCLDCVSSIGAVPLELDGVSLVTGVAGKAIGSYPGLAFVFASRQALEEIRGGVYPCSMDIRSAIEHRGPQFTTPSPQLFALDKALALDYATPDLFCARFERYYELGLFVRNHLRKLGLTPLVEESHAAPSITTFQAPCDDFVARCRDLGYEIAGESGYLRERSWAQIGVMGGVQEGDLTRLFEELQRNRLITA